MSQIPAVCDSCGTFFLVRNLFSGNFTLQMEGNKTGPCPECGGYGSLPDGTFSVVNSALRLLSGPKSSVEVMARLEVILEKAKQDPPNFEEFRQEIGNVPGIGPALLTLLPETKNEWYTFITLLLAIIAFLYTVQLPQPLNEEQTARAVQQGVEAAQETKKNQDLGPGRNQICPCGTGKKYKNCCGRDELSPSDRLLRDLQNGRKNPDYGTGGYRT